MYGNKITIVSKIQANLIPFSRLVQRLPRRITRNGPYIFKSFQWRIHDFPDWGRGDANLQGGGTNLLFSQFFPQKTA